MLNMQKKMSTAFYALLSLPATAMGFGLSVQISALSWILNTKYGLDIHEIGIVWAAGPIAGIIAQPIVGALSDKLWFMGGRRRPWIILGGLLTGLMLLALPNLGIIQKVFGASGSEGLLAIAVVVALTLDLSINVSFNPTRSLVADCTNQSQRSKGYTWMQTVSGTFGVLAYLIAVIWGNIVLIYVGVAIALLFTIVPMIFIEEPRYLESEVSAEEVKQPKKKTSIKDFNDAMLPLYGFLIYGVYVIIAKLFGLEDTSSVSIFGFFSLSTVELICVIIELIAIVMVLANILKADKNTHQFQKILLSHSFTWWGVQTMNIYMLFYVANVINLDSDMIRTFVSSMSECVKSIASTMTDDVNANEITKFIQNLFSNQSINSLAFLVRDLVGAILPVLVLNVLAKKIGMTHTHTYCILLMALGYAIIYAFGANIVVFFVGLVIVGIGWASLVSLPFAIMSEYVDQNKMGLYMGIFNLSVVLPQLVASFKMGEVVSAAPDKSIIFAICALCLFVSGVLWFTVREKK